MEGGISFSSEDYIYDIKHNESFFRNSKVVYNIKPVWSLRGHNNSIEGIHIINNKYFVTISHDCVISFWDFDKNNLSNIKLQYPILSSSFNKRKKLMAVGLTNKDTNVYLVDVEKYKVSEKVNSKSDSIFCLDYFDDHIMTCGSKSGSILLIDLSKKKNVYRYEEIDDCISSCSFNFTHNIHFFGTYRGNLSIFDFRKPLPVYKNKYFHSQHSVNSVFSFNNCLFTAGSDCLIKKFDIRLFDEQKPLNVYMGHTSPIHYLSFSPNFSFFCSSSDNGSIRLWKSDEQTNAIQYLCSPFVNEKKKGSKVKSEAKSETRSETKSENKSETPKLLKVNTEREKKRDSRSTSIASETKTSKPFFFKNDNLKIHNKDNIGFTKRALTPNFPKTQERKVSTMSKKQIFIPTKINIQTKTQIKTKTQTKINELGGSLLYSSKVPYGIRTDKRVTNTINDTLNIKIGSRLRPSASINPPVRRSNLKSKGAVDIEKKKNISKLNDKKQNELTENKTTATNMFGKSNDNYNNRISSETQRSIKDGMKIILGEDELPIVFKTEIKSPILSMIHHKNRVSSMDWLEKTVVSVSWDQTIKCWDLSNYVQ